VATLAGPRKPRSGPLPMLRQLADEDGQGLGGHRLVFEASGLGPGARPGDPIPKVFERVAGARVTGMATPGEPVTADLELRTNRGRRVLYRARTITGPEGRYILRLPYANTGGQGPVQTASHYRVRSQGVEDQIRVDERQVVHGDSAVGPNFGS
jgi:asparagine N-glycosylation enzyme membrane subunit Stt3